MQGGTSSIPGQGVKIHLPHGQKTKTQNRSNIVTNSIKMLKMVHIKKKKTSKTKLAGIINGYHLSGILFGKLYKKCFWRTASFLVTGLNVCVLPQPAWIHQIHSLKPNLHCPGIWRWGSWEVIRSAVCWFEDGSNQNSDFKLPTSRMVRNKCLQFISHPV